MTEQRVPGARPEINTDPRRENAKTGDFPDVKFYHPGSHQNFALNPNPLRRSWAEIDLSALRHNVAVLRDLTGPGTGLMAVVKANAYGHGLEEIASALYCDVDWFGVANVAEALRIRQSIAENCPRILVLSPLTPDEYETAVSQGFSCPVSNQNEIALYAETAKKLGKTANLHAVADTGMGRMGSLPTDWYALVAAIRENQFCTLEGAATHFPNADEDAEFTRRQIAQFREMTQDLDCEIHLANSAGDIDFASETSFATFARAGLALYGISPECSNDIDLHPALTWKSRVTLVRELPTGSTISYGSTFTTEKPMRVATIATGYGDGYPRQLSGSGADVLIAGHRCPLLGRVTMDQIMVDVSHVSGLSAGDEVTLLGGEISADELAQKAGTIPWEILTNLSSRVERVYH